MIFSHVDVNTDILLTGDYYEFLEKKDTLNLFGPLTHQYYIWI